MQRQKCMNCSDPDLHMFIDLGEQPNGNNFIFADQIHSEPTYPMKMLVCANCWQVQIDEFPSQKVLFDDHPYVSGVNVPVVEHFQTLAENVAAQFRISSGDVVLDIGCNDGSLLSAFRNTGATTIGVDPGKRVTELARQNGHMACRTFWNTASAAAVKQLGVAPRVISATAVFYHVPDLHDFIQGLDLVMDDETVFVVQGVSMDDVLTKFQFDHFYHEHSCIHSVTSLNTLFAQHNMKIFDVAHFDIHGGSFVAYVAKNSSQHKISHNVAAMIEQEKRNGLTQLESYFSFAKQVKENIDAIKKLLVDLKASGKTVFGLGAPLKGSTLLNYGGIGPDLVQCLTEVNAFKIGRLSPGSHIPVMDEKTMEAEPDYYLVLAWNFLDFFIRKKIDYLNAGGKFIVPGPSLQVLDRSCIPN